MKVTNRKPQTLLMKSMVLDGRRTSDKYLYLLCFRFFSGIGFAGRGLSRLEFEFLKQDYNLYSNNCINVCLVTLGTDRDAPVISKIKKTYLIRCKHLYKYMHKE